MALALAKDAAAFTASISHPINALESVRLCDRGAISKAAYPGISDRIPVPSSEGANLDKHFVMLPAGPEANINDSQLASGGRVYKYTEEPEKTKNHSTFTHQISDQVSSSFGNPTVVHRPNMRTRPTLLSLNGSAWPGGETLTNLSPNSLESTTLSSVYTTGSISTGHVSTAKTSLESNVTSAHMDGDPNILRLNERGRPAVDQNNTGDLTLEKPLTPIPEATSAPLMVLPTVFTVESTANAKIFFETHFNALLAGHASPRTMRRRIFESRLKDLPISQEQRRQEYSAWALGESEHLRQTRILKSKTHRMSYGSGVAVAGYEIIRILGKGSFGVVRLVREKDTKTLEIPSINTMPAKNATNATKKAMTRVDTSSLKVTAFEAFKATLDGQRSNHRRTTKKVPLFIYDTSSHVSASPPLLSHVLRLTMPLTNGNDRLERRCMQ